MNERRTPISAELRPFVDRSEAAEIDRVAERLRESRPTPDPAFREQLGRALAEHRPLGSIELAGPRLRLTVLALACSGAALLLVGYLLAR